MPLHEFKDLRDGGLPPINATVLLWNGQGDDPNFCVATLKIDMEEEPPEYYWDAWNDQQYSIHEWQFYALIEVP